MKAVFNLLKGIKVTYWIIAALVVVILVMAATMRAPKPTEEYKQEQKALTVQEKLLQDNQAIILKQMDLQDKILQMYQDKDEQLIRALQDDQQKIQIIKQQTDAKINSIDRYQSDDLKRYFTEIPIR